MQSRFGIEMEDDEILGENFETFGQLAAFVQFKCSELSQDRSRRP